MYPTHSQAFLTGEQRFNDRFPLATVAVLATIQMLTTFGIIALEIAHNLISIQRTNLFAGFWTAIPFTVLWISMFAAVCCCRRRSCATHAVIHNVISFIFASALIGINIAFIQRPNQCFFTSNICESLSWDHSISLPFGCYFDGKSSDCQDTRMALIKSQLAGGVVIAVICFIYLIMYFVASSKTARRNRHQTRSAADQVMVPVHPRPYVMPPQPSAPMMVPASHQMPMQYNNPGYVPPNQYPTLYPQINNDRF